MIDLSHIPPSDDPQVVKYADTTRWLTVCDRRARDLGLHAAEPRSVLDIATGAGYFPFVCRGYGHRVTATDRARRDRFYRDVTAALGIDVIDDDVSPFRPLRVDGTFDVITSFMITFNGHRSPNLWGVAEWRYFIDDLEQRLNPGGVIALQLNREPNGQTYPPGVVGLLRRRGAEIDRHRVTIRRSTPGEP